MGLAGATSADMARYFHVNLAAMTAEAAATLAQAQGLNTVALSGGVLQNTLFTTLVAKRLQKHGLRVLRHSMVPPNDGGLCLGQAAFAMHHLQTT